MTKEPEEKDFAFDEFISLIYHFESSLFSYLGSCWPSRVRSKYLYSFIPIDFFFSFLKMRSG